MRAYKYGFFYCMNNALKGSYGNISPQNILHPSEVTWLYEQNFLDIMKGVISQMQRQNVSSTEKAKWIEQFIAQNPLTHKAIHYAYKPQDPKRQILEAWSSSFDAYRQDVLSVQRHFTERSNQIHHQANKEFGKIEEQRNLALALPLSIKRTSDDEASRLRKERLEVEGISEEDRYEIRKEYDAMVNNNQTYYLTIANPINLYYNNSRAEIEAWQAECLREIEQEKLAGVSFYFEPGLELFTRAYDSWEKQKYDEAACYRSQEFFFEELMPPPSAPPLKAG